MKSIKVRATLFEDILGTLPGDPQIYRNYIASKIPADVEDREKRIEEEINAIIEEGENKITVFARNPEGNPIIYDYLIKGFFKNACKAMREADGSKSKGLSAYKTKIDNLVFVEPRMIPINFDGEISICERPLRASTAQGERIALAASECISAPATLEFTVTTLKDDMMNCIIEWLDYGKFNGLGQWHNSGKGRFTWEDITEE